MDWSRVYRFQTDKYASLSLPSAPASPAAVDTREKSELTPGSVPSSFVVTCKTPVPGTTAIEKGR